MEITLPVPISRFPESSRSPCCSQNVWWSCVMGSTAHLWNLEAWVTHEERRSPSIWLFRKRRESGGEGGTQSSALLPTGDSQEQQLVLLREDVDTITPFLPLKEKVTFYSGGKSEWIGWRPRFKFPQIPCSTGEVSTWDYKGSCKSKCLPNTLVEPQVGRL